MIADDPLATTMHSNKYRNKIMVLVIFFALQNWPDGLAGTEMECISSVELIYNCY